MFQYKMIKDPYKSIEEMEHIQIKKEKKRRVTHFVLFVGLCCNVATGKYLQTVMNVICFNDNTRLARMRISGAPKLVPPLSVCQESRAIWLIVLSPLLSHKGTPLGT